MTTLLTSKFSVNRTFRGLAMAGLLTAIGGAAFAQTPPAGMRAPEAMRDAPPADAKMGRMGYGDPAKMQAKMAKHQAALKASLKLTPAQEPAWTTFTAAMQPAAGMGMGWRHSPEQRAEMDKLNTPQRIDKMREMRTQHLAVVDKRMDATKAFYAALTPEQQKVFDAGHTMRGGGHGGGHHGGMAHGPSRSAGTEPTR